MCVRYSFPKAVVVFTVAVLIPGAAHAGSPGDKHLEDEHALSLEFATPHTKWATPYARGPVKVLFFAGRRDDYTKGRHVVELLQRFDLRAETAWWDIGSRQWVGGEAGIARIARLLGEPWDVFVFLDVSPQQLPEEHAAAVMSRVAQGAGLVLVGAEETPFPEVARKPIERPAWLPADDTYLLDRGRTVHLPAREEIAYGLGWEVQYDYQAEKLGRAILWAARREPQMTLRVQLPQELVRAQLPTAGQVQWASAPEQTKLQIRVRGADGRIVRTLAAPCRDAEGTATVELPRLRAGRYHVDVIARSPEGVQCWTTAPVTVTSARTIKSVDLHSTWAEIGDWAAGSVELAEEALPGQQLTLQVVDRRGRILIRQDLDVQGRTSPFRFRIEPWMPMLLRVEAVLSDTDGEVAAGHTFFRVTKRHQGQFNFIVWSSPDDTLGPYGVESLARMGVTTVLNIDAEPSLPLAAYEIASVPFAAWLGGDPCTVGGSLNEHGMMKTGCWNEPGPDGVTGNVRSAVRRCAAARGHGVLAYSLGDEGAVRGSCLTSHCLKAYQAYLREIYGRVDALNTEWGTRFKSFDEVTLSEAGPLPANDAPEWFKTYYEERLATYARLYTPEARCQKTSLSPEEIRNGDINDEIAALQAGNFPRWYDRQAFQCYNLVQLCKRYAEGFRRLDPKAMTGFEGAGHFQISQHPIRIRQGGDVDLIIRELDWWGPYATSPVNEIIRSIAPKDFAWGNWIGYAKHADGLLDKYWRMVCQGATQVQWWKYDGAGQFHGLLAPHLGPYPATEEFLKDTQVIRDGLGTLLVKSTMLEDGIALLYSMPSTYITHFDGNSSYGEYQSIHEAWHETLHGLGLQFRYVTDRMLRRGEFDGTRYKVLILPFAAAIGPKEAEVIRMFVQSGGTVIADVRPAIYDSHCKRLEKGQLDDLFGIRREGRSGPTSATVAISGTMAGRQLAVDKHEVNVDPAVRTTTGRALGGKEDIPVCIVNQAGRGRSILLNMTLTSSTRAILVEQLLAAAGVEPQVMRKKHDGTELDTVQVIRWQNGGIEFLALLGPHAGLGPYTGPAQVDLPDERFVYNLRHRESLGRVKSFTTPLRAHRASFFALLPAPIPAPTLALDRESATRGTVVTATARIPQAAGLHALQLHATMPDGKPADWLRQVVIVSDKPASAYLPIAHNDPVGDWSIKVIDLYSDFAVTTTLTVR